METRQNTPWRAHCSISTRERERERKRETVAKDFDTNLYGIRTRCNFSLINPVPITNSPSERVDRELISNLALLCTSRRVHLYTFMPTDYSFFSSFLFGRGCACALLARTREWNTWIMMTSAKCVRVGACCNVDFPRHTLVLCIFLFKGFSLMALLLSRWRSWFWT